MDVYKAVSSTEDTSCLTMDSSQDVENNKSYGGTQQNTLTTTTIQNTDGEQV